MVISERAPETLCTALCHCYCEREIKKAPEGAFFVQSD
jgi:hypothetical protein